MKRRILLLASTMLSIPLLFTACASKDIGETKAREIGLAYVNQAFDVNEKEGTVSFFQQTERIYQGGEMVEIGNQKKKSFYSVTVENDRGETLYYVEIEAKTGEAFRIERNPRMLTMTTQQRDQAESLGAFDVFSTTRFNQEPKQAAEVAAKWVQERFEPENEIGNVTTNNTYTDSKQFPQVSLDSFVVMKSGKVYNVTVCWPTMEVVQVAILNQAD